MANLTNLCFNNDCTPVVESYTKPEVDEFLRRKQNKLTAGVGIDITNDVIKATIDADVFIPVTTLPSASTADNQKIYLTPKTGGGVEEWHVIDVDGTPTWDKFGEADIDLSKEHLLEILDLEAVPYEIEECDGTVSTYTVLARRQRSFADVWAVTFYSGSYKEAVIKAKSIDIYAGNELIGHIGSQESMTDIDGNGAFSVNANTPTSEVQLRISIKGVSCDGVGLYDYEGTAETVVIEGEGTYVENVSMTGVGCIEIESIFTE